MAQNPNAPSLGKCVKFFRLVDIDEFQLEKSFVQRPSWFLGNHPCLHPVYHGLSKEPRRDSIRSKQVVSFVRCSYYVVNPWCPSSSSGLFGTWPKEGLLSAAWLSSCSLRPWWLCPVVSSACSLSGSWGSTSAVTR